MDNFEKGNVIFYPGVRWVKMDLVGFNVREWEYEGEKVFKDHQNMVVSNFIGEIVWDSSQYLTPKL